MCFSFCDTGFKYGSWFDCFGILALCRKNICGLTSVRFRLCMFINYVCYLVECYCINCTAKSTVNMEAGFSALTKKNQQQQKKLNYLLCTIKKPLTLRRICHNMYSYLTSENHILIYSSMILFPFYFSFLHYIMTWGCRVECKHLCLNHLIYYLLFVILYKVLKRCKK